MVGSKEIAYLVDASAKPIDVEPQFWNGNRDTFNAEDGIIQNYGAINGRARIVFRTVDLDIGERERRDGAKKKPSSVALPDTEEYAMPGPDPAVSRAILEVYAAAMSQKIAIPNNRQIISHVQNILARKKQQASGNQIERLAEKERADHVDKDPYAKFFLKKGQSPSDRGLRPAKLLVI